MKRIFTYVLIALGIVAGFCLAFTIIMVLVVKDADGSHELSERWMPYISLILVVALPAVIVWGMFRLLRNVIFKNIRRDELQKPSEDDDKMS